MPNLEEVDWSYTEILISFDNEKFLIQVNSLILLGRKMSKYLTSIFSELLGVAYTQIRNPDSNLSLLGRS